MRAIDFVDLLVQLGPVVLADLEDETDLLEDSGRNQSGEAFCDCVGTSGPPLRTKIYFRVVLSCLKSRPQQCSNLHRAWQDLKLRLAQAFPPQDRVQ